MSASDWAFMGTRASENLLCCTLAVVNLRAQASPAVEPIEKSKAMRMLPVRSHQFASANPAIGVTATSVK